MADLDEKRGTTNETGRYGFALSLPLPYEQAVGAVVDALKAEGFGVLTEIDVRDTLKKKLDVEFQRYIILGACNPPLAYQALRVEPDLGLLLPCNVVVHEEGEGTRVVFVDPRAMLGVAANPVLQPVADEVTARLERVAAHLGEGAGEPHVSQ
ncbi:MAG: DUF302 domain-containing protein [Chloroflexi bacterium]|nr:DUF302 domain-containing protein [Chloroflexota bacterium]